MPFLRTCPATGRLSHHFDATTHRCVCGRWERGFKPTCAPVRPRGECQICERQQALDGAGNLGHHDYKRPGWGFIQGDCLGVGHKVYPATDALVIYLAAVRTHITKCQGELSRLPEVEEVSYAYEAFRVTEAAPKGTRTKCVHTIKKGDEARYDGELRAHIPCFDSRIKIREGQLKNEIAFASADEKRVVARIAKATS